MQGKYVMPAGKSGSAGTALVLAACDGSTAHQWEPTSDRTLLNQASGLCADVTGSSTAAGTAVVTAACNTATTGQSIRPPIACTRWPGGPPAGGHPRLARRRRAAADPLREDGRRYGTP
ncbi:ricin-type beta-trefoil lectin domain protein [Streptomyces sp. 4503]|uniref:Ricin-type beta-trefoil lectin domain protein n=1 Tax=Streptomyces niphimycinicus TaxID=2842201 RepID=A0ABS6CFR1_9ACTN|nr:ricin-type beta-trefoil lectin domain protein [Streptomyces niphimycinicus]